VSGVSHPSS